MTCPKFIKRAYIAMENKNQNGSRITISQARKALGMIGRNYSDEDITEILRLMREVSELTYGDIADSD